MFSLRSLSASLSPLLLVACAHGALAPDNDGAGAQLPEIGMPLERDEAAPNASTLGVNDVFEVRVFGEKDLSGVHRVGPGGEVTYPLCGEVQVLGMDASALAARLVECLSDGYLRDPQVSVFVREYNSKKVFVLGQVNKPGTFTFEDDMSIVEVITRAGGFTRLAAKNKVVVNRVVGGREQLSKIQVEDISLGLAPNFILYAGDIVYVPESFF